MSAPVDVLAVMDRAFGSANEHYDDLKSAADEPALGPAYQRACRYMKEHREARAAVAELIATGDRVTAAFRALGLDSSLTNRSRLARECEKSMVAFDAALARVKGGAA